MRKASYPISSLHVVHRDSPEGAWVLSIEEDDGQRMLAEFYDGDENGSYLAGLLLLAMKVDQSIQPADVVKTALHMYERLQFLITNNQRQAGLAVLTEWLLTTKHVVANLQQEVLDCRNCISALERRLGGGSKA